MNLFDKLEKFSKNISVIDEDLNSFTYKDLLLLADKLGKKIQSRKVIFLICKNNYEFIASYVGLIRAKAVIFLINNSLSSKKLGDLINHYKPKYLLIPKENQIPNIKLNEILNLNNKYQLFETNFKIIHKVYEELALLMSTSGTTGSPKFVKLSYLNLFDNAKKIAKFLNIKSSDRPITTMQASYSYGLSIINSHLISGSSIIITELSLFEKKFWEIFRKKKATTFGGVPFIFEILKKLNFNKMNLPHLDYITQAGGKLDSSLLIDFVKIFKEKKIKFYLMYGATEATARMSYLNWKLSKKKIGSIGKPLRGSKFYILDNRKKLIKKANETGELVYKGRNVMLGYAEKIDDLKNKSSNNKILHTGDVAYKDNEGFYYIVGRKSRYIKVFGTRLSLDDVEFQIKKKGIDCACIGRDDNLQIFLINLNKKIFILNYLHNYFGIRKSIIKINRIKKIPRGNNGKILYSNLERFADG